MSIVAVSLVTESGDHYLLLFTDIISPKDFADRVTQDMGEELTYVYEHTVVTEGGGQMAQILLSNALQGRIEELQQLEDGFND